MAMEIAPTTPITDKKSVKEFWEYKKKVESGEIPKDKIVLNKASKIYDEINQQK